MRDSLKSPFAAFCKSAFSVLVVVGSLTGLAQKVDEVRVEGNAKVETAAILNLISLQVGTEYDTKKVGTDILALYELGYFSDVKVYSEQNGNKLVLKVKVTEKPAITSIEYRGLNEIREEDFKDQIETKLYTIVDEGRITSDARKIEKKYSEKGYYLAKVNYVLEPRGKNEVALVYLVNESGKVLVGDVNIQGIHYFSYQDLIDKFASKPYTRGRALSSASLYQEDLVSRDLDFLQFYYRDWGFAEVKVAKPISYIDADQHFVRINFAVEEGVQYSVGTIAVSGDIGDGLYQESQLLEWMLLKPGKLFRYSQFAKDVEMLNDKYGDLGYAYVDVNPMTNFNQKTAVVDLNFKIAKGTKVYFGESAIVGNTKTRDNVIRREFEVNDSELYSGTRLTASKTNINRLGYFEEVQVLKERNAEVEDVLNLKLKVKEKPTGQLQAAIGYSPGQESKQSWFGQARYDEKNQSGRGWETNVSGKYANDKDYAIDLGFADPRVNDSDWSAGTDFAYRRLDHIYASDITIPEAHTSVSLTVGRKIIELIRASLTLRHTKVTNLEEVFVFKGFQTAGVKNALVLGLSRKSLDNNIDPTQGSTVYLNHTFTGGILGGDFDFMESMASSSYYIPWDFTDTYRTYFKLSGTLGKLWRSTPRTMIPYSERYRLGGYNDLRGYPSWSISPVERRNHSPMGGNYDYYIGGDKELFFQFEYFLPLIPEAGIKSLFFTDMGRVYREDENISFSNFKKDMGFGIRWITPIAPFRFEWAYPYDDETRSFGNVQFIFTLGY